MAFEGTDDFTRLTQYDDTLRGDARRFELITLPYQDFAGMNASLGLLLELGVERIADAPPAPARAGARLGRSGRRAGWCRRAGARGSGILCLAPPESVEAFRALKAARIICSLREGAIRLSPHAYNTVAEMERVVAVLEGVCQRDDLSEHRKPAVSAPMAPRFDPEMLAAATASPTPPSPWAPRWRRHARFTRSPRSGLPLAMMNRHGLIAGATGTGKTKTLQLLTEQLSAQGVPVFVADMKGDLSGLAMPGEASDRVTGRAKDIGWAWKPAGVPVEFVSLTGKLGRPAPRHGELVRAAAAGQGALAQRHPDQRAHDGLQVLRRQPASAARPAGPPGGAPVPRLGRGQAGAGAVRRHVRRPPVGVLLRKMIELESQGAGQFFGEPEFDVKDMLQLTSDGRGVVTCLELPDVQDKPLLWSTFMMWMLAELYHNLPEAGDLPKPKLAFFFDEAHLLFADALEGVSRRRCSRWCGSSGPRASASIS